MLKTAGAFVRATYRTGSAPEPLKCRCHALIGGENILPRFHSKVIGFLPSFHTVVAPLPRNT
jgi:hypothetical protein